MTRKDTDSSGWQVVKCNSPHRPISAHPYFCSSNSSCLNKQVDQEPSLPALESDALLTKPRPLIPSTAYSALSSLRHISRPQVQTGKKVQLVVDPADTVFACEYLPVDAAAGVRGFDSFAHPSGGSVEGREHLVMCG